MPVFYTHLDVYKRQNVETEIKFPVKDFYKIKEIYDVLANMFIVYPYDKTMLYDIYFDTKSFDLLKSGCSYRVRNKRNRSINFKTKGQVIHGILSRFEYRDPVENKLSLDEILSIKCETNDMVKAVFDLYDETLLEKKIILCSYRTSYLLYYKDGNDVKKFAVCSFDKFFDTSRKEPYYEIEIES